MEDLKELIANSERLLIWCTTRPT